MKNRVYYFQGLWFLLATSLLLSACASLSPGARSEDTSETSQWRRPSSYRSRL